MRFRLTCFIALALCAGLAFGQGKTGGSTVSGRVFCDDTNAPARMVTVMLQPAAAVDAMRAEKPKEMESEAQAVQTLLDGSFAISNVSSGTYYVIASAPGYISPLNMLLQAEKDPSTDDATRARLAAQVPRVTVQANLPASVNITLQRGGAVSGTILYDDGTPAVGLHVSLLVRRNDKWVPTPSVGFQQAVTAATTDDRGNYRINGLPDQKYIAIVELNLSSWVYKTFAHGGSGISSNSGYSLPVYSGNAMRTKDAKPFGLTQGEERSGEDIQIPISKLHSMRGAIIAKSDGHTLNGGKVALLYPDDKSQMSEATVTKDAEFNFVFVPEGDYLLRVEDGTDVEYKEIPNPANTVPSTRTESHVLRHYGAAEAPIHVGSNDMTGVTVAAPDLQKAASGN